MEDPYYEPKRDAHAKLDPFTHPSGLDNIRYSVLRTILPEVLFFTAVATFVSVVTDRSSKRLELPSLLIGVLGTVLGFIVSYRTSSAAERYGEGRKLWASVVLASRTWARMVWIHVPNSFSVRAEDVPVPEDEIVKAIIEKRTSMNLCAGFSVALKHYLRGEGGIYYKDLYPLMSFIPRYSLPTSLPANNDDRPDVPRSQNMRSTISSAYTTNGFTTTPVLDSRPGVSRSSSSIKIKTVNLGYHQLVPSQPLLPSRNPPPSDLFAIASYIPFFSLAQELLLLVTRRYRRDKQKRSMRHRRLAGARVNENIPLEVTLLLSAYVAVLSKRKVIDATVINPLLATIASLTDSLTGLERILLTPIPVSYYLHLQHTIWLYLLLFPSQIHSVFGWLTIPATCLVSFIFIGFLAIGEQIENPFGYDNDDLPLEDFCHIIQKEFSEIVSHTPLEVDPSSFYFSSSNLPFATFGSGWRGVSALEMVEGSGISLDEVQGYLRAGALPRPGAGTKVTSAGEGEYA